jgi:hypothetical protein
MPPEQTSFEVAPDGQRFLFASPERPFRPAPFIVVLHWQAALKR